MFARWPWSLIVVFGLCGCGHREASTPTTQAPTTQAPAPALQPKDAELERAAETIERAYALAPQPRLLAALALAWERIGKLEPARRLVEQLHVDPRRADLAERLLGQLAILEERLATQARGEPHVDDPVLRRELIELAGRIERRLDEMTTHAEQPHF